MLHIVLKAGFVICLLGFLGCWAVGFVLAVSRFPKSMRAGLRFNELRRAGMLKPDDLALKPGDKRFLAGYIRIWLCALGFLLGALILFPFRV